MRDVTVWEAVSPEPFDAYPFRVADPTRKAEPHRPRCRGKVLQS